MASEKKDSLTSTRIKTVVVKRRFAQPSANSVAPEGEHESEKNSENKKLPKKSKLAVRVVGRDLPVKEKGSRSKKTESDFFDRISHRIEETKVESADYQKSKEKKKPRRETESRPVGMYRKISIFFIFLTLALLAAAFYFFIVSLTVEVTPKSERISDKLDIIVANSSSNQAGANLSGAAGINGSVEQIPVKEQKIYEATGANVLGQEITGKVSIINNYSQDKTLVATTRLLTSDGKLFRIKDKISIPAGGSTEVEIYTDEPSPEMAIGPTTFNIPGLWAGLQDKIYAKSATAFVYQSNVQKFVQAMDIEKAAQDIKESLIKKVNDQFASNYKGFDKVIVQIDKDSLVSSSSVKANMKVNSFNLSLSANVDIVAFHTADVLKLAEDKLISVMPAGEKLAGLNQDETQYNLISGDFKNGTANLEVPFVGTMSLSDIGNAVDKTKLVGLSGAQIVSYLNSLDKFSDVKLIFMPSFINKAPSLVDRIKIVIN
ncbi:MAG: hypothetical protein PHO56_01985 [Patescibacteria group bacterium]|nr:hypothetical protein [Patescibacteria group bacterium]